jgi:hypothetical protein
MRRLIYILTILVLVSCVTDDGTKSNISQTADSLTTNPKSNKSQTTDSLTTKTKININWTFDKVQDSKLIFKGGQTFETNLFELEYLGQVSGDDKAPFLIFSGRDCNECDANISIYIHSPSDGKLVIDHGQNRYQYPGTEKDYETARVIYISRAFYGQVLDNINGVIWYENRLLENGKMGRFVFLSRIDNGSLKDTTYDDNGKLDQTIRLKNKGLCNEIVGRKYTSEP